MKNHLNKLFNFSSSTDHDDSVSPVAGVAAGVTQLLQTSAPVTVESEQEVSDVLVLRQLTQLWTRVILWSRTCAVEASITLASPGQLKLMKSIRQRGERMSEVPEVSSQTPDPLQLSTRVHCSTAASPHWTP